jgi:hypothetical protein
MQTSFFTSFKRVFLFAVPPDAPFVGASDIGHGSYGPGYMQLGPGIEPRTDKKIASYDMGFEPRTHVPYKKSFVARSTKNTNVHVERVHDVHVERRQRSTNDGQTDRRRTTARPTEFLDLRKKIQDPKFRPKKICSSQNISKNPNHVMYHGGVEFYTPPRRNMSTTNHIIYYNDVECYITPQGPVEPL